MNNINNDVNKFTKGYLEAYCRVNPGCKWNRGKQYVLNEASLKRLRDVYMSHKNGETYAIIAKRYGVSINAIRQAYVTANQILKYMDAKKPLDIRWKKEENEK